LNSKILVVDDEKNIVDILKFNLVKDHYDVVEAYNGVQAMEKALKEKPDLILLDIMLPKIDGFTVCKNLRQTISTPILMISAKEEEIDKVLGLELGADDYITKPFKIRELIARVKANLRRTTHEIASNSLANIINYDNLYIDIDHYEIKREGEKIELTLREFELMKSLALKPGEIFTREKLLEKVWGYDYIGDVRTVDVMVTRLRGKLEKDPCNPEYIMTKRGIGYYFNRVSIK
jgi:two-component system response regulator VicR